MFLTRDGTPCSYEHWHELLTDSNYRILQSDELPNGIKVDTDWIGIDGRSFYFRPPRIERDLIFVTMVRFPNKRPKRATKYLRYATEQEAQKGHEAVVRKY